MVYQGVDLNVKHDLRKIWWLASYPKSGNTWVRMFLDAYVTRQVDLNTYYGHFAFGDLHPPSYQAVCPWPLTEAPKYIWPALRIPALLQMIANRPGSLCLKTHHAKIDCDGMPLIPPRLTQGAIYLVRDPRDVAVSWAHHASISIDQAIDFLASKTAVISNVEVGMGHVLRSWSEHVESWVGDNENVPTQVIRYEDLVADPAGQFRAILEAMKFPDIDEDRLQWAIEASSFDKLRQREEAKGFREKKGGDHFFRVGQAGGWQLYNGNGHQEYDAEEVGCPELLDDIRPVDAGERQTLTASQVRRIEEAHGDVMAALGYELQETELTAIIGEIDECENPIVCERADSVG